MKELIVLWILTSMTHWSPPHRTHFVPEAAESYVQADARYRETAEAIVAYSYRKDMTPIFGGKKGRMDTSMLLAVIWFTESGFRRDIDLGTSRRRLSYTGLNDFGRSWCMGQINLGTKMVPGATAGTLVETSNTNTAEGWSGPELIADRGKCAAATVRILKMSLQDCASLPFTQRLTSYASGICKVDPNLPDKQREKDEARLADGKRKSEGKMRLFNHWKNKNRPTITDQEVLDEIEANKDKLPPAPEPPLVSFAP